MWTIERGRLISPQKVELTYIRKDQLISIDTQGICQSLEIFCPETIKLNKLPWQKFWTINTQDWVLEIIKFNGIAQTIARPLIFQEIANIQELYLQIQTCDRDQAETPRDFSQRDLEQDPQSEQNISFSTLDSDCSA